MINEQFPHGIKNPKDLGRFALDIITRSRHGNTEQHAIAQTEALVAAIRHPHILRRASMVGVGLAKFAFRAIMNPDSVQHYIDTISAIGRDDLTGLSNRSRFLAALDGEMKTGETAAVMMFDLINFGYINNTYGQLVGDRFLQLFADSLRQNFRSESTIPTDRRADYLISAVPLVDDTVASRIGGDEFAVLLRDGDTLNAQCLSTLALNKAIGLLGSPDLIAAMKQCGVSEFGVRVGAALRDQQTISYDDVMTRADHKTHTEWAVVLRRDMGPNGMFCFYVNRDERDVLYALHEHPYLSIDHEDVVVEGSVLYIPVANRL